MTDWLLDAAELLTRPDPGPTPWLVEDLIVDKAIVAAVGRWKTTKSYGLLDICISIATGEGAFGTLPVAQGAVVFVNEESGEVALRRRLNALCRGRAINPERLRDCLYVAANKRIRLDDREWQKRIANDCGTVGARLIVFDPLARMKNPERVENDQSGMAPLIEYLRQLRDDLNATVCFVHHTGHQGDHMRGSSDLESAWETRLQWKRDGQSPIVTIESEHREAEAGEPLQYKIGWDAQTRSMRFDAVTDSNLAKVVAHLREHPDDSGNKVFEAVGGTRAEVLAIVKSLRQQGGTEPSYHPRTTTPEAPLAGGTRGASLEALVPPPPEPGTEPSYHHPKDGDIVRPHSSSNPSTGSPGTRRERAVVDGATRRPDDGCGAHRAPRRGVRARFRGGRRRHFASSARGARQGQASRLRRRSRSACPRRRRPPSRRSTASTAPSARAS